MADSLIVPPELKSQVASPCSFLFFHLNVISTRNNGRHVGGFGVEYKRVFSARSCQSISTKAFDVLTVKCDKYVFSVLYRRPD